MNNKILIIIIAIVLLAGLGFVIFGANTNRSENQTTQQTPAQSSSQTGSGDTMMQGEDSGSDTRQTPSDGSYLAYSEANFQATSDKRRVLFFYASWCPTCRPADKEFQASSDQIPEDVVVLRVNYNDSDTDRSEKALADRYGVTYQHTFVQIDENGNEIAKWNGGAMDELLENLK